MGHVVNLKITNENDIKNENQNENESEIENQNQNEIVNEKKVWKYKIAHNLCLTDGKDTKFAPQQDIRMKNIFCNLVKIRYDDVIFCHLTSFSYTLAKKCWRQQKIIIMNQPYFIFSKRPHNSFHLRGQPLSYD